MGRWGVPDWRDKGAYPRHEWPTQWRWEFLRRLAAYRTDWERRSNAAQLAAGEEADRLVAQGIGHPMPPKGFSSWREALSRKGFSADGRHREKWGLNCLEDPANPIPPHSSNWVKRDEDLESLHPYQAMRFGWDISDRDWSNEGETEVYLKFDLSKSLAEQVRRATEHLKAMQAEADIKIGNRRHTADELIRYLRVLDAKDAGATNREIGEALCPPKQGEEAAIEAKRLYRTARGVQLRYVRKSHLSAEKS